ncbi:MAG: VOC family protein [Pseudomonadota bacterium]
MSQIDHLVIGAAALDTAVDWARERFGVAPAARGRHPLMSTHNALWHLAVPGQPDAYLEIVAIDPDVPDPGRPRWFGLDRPETQAMLVEAPRLLTWQIRPSAGLDAAIGTAGVPTGPALAVTRDALSWRLTVPEDGTMPFGGRFPVMIEWDPGVPTPPETLPPAGLSLESLTLAGDPALSAALARVGAEDLVSLGAPEAPPIEAVLTTPAGRVTLR